MCLSCQSLQPKIVLFRIIHSSDIRMLLHPLQMHRVMTISTAYSNARRQHSKHMVSEIFYAYAQIRRVWQGLVLEQMVLSVSGRCLFTYPLAVHR